MRKIPTVRKFSKIFCSFLFHFLKTIFRTVLDLQKNWEDGTESTQTPVWLVPIINILR